MPKRAFWSALALTATLLLVWQGLTARPLRASDADIHDLQKQVESLSKRIGELNSRISELEAIKPTFTAFMPDFSERFHVMHAAGDAGDWAVANHELAEMKRMVTVASSIDPEKGPLLAAFMGERLHELGEAIEHGDSKTFKGELEQTVRQCNACHVAAHSPFIKVGLDHKELLSFRHSHVLQPSKSSMKHLH